VMKGQGWRLKLSKWVMILQEEFMWVSECFFFFFCILGCIKSVFKSWVWLLSKLSTYIQSTDKSKLGVAICTNTSVKMLQPTYLGQSW
jgi:hypothetical protein